jgi:hypothetical protein
LAPEKSEELLVEFLGLQKQKQKLSFFLSLLRFVNLTTNPHSLAKESAVVIGGMAGKKS